MIRFDFVEPASLEEAINLLKQYDGDARILAGGTDLLPRLRQRLININYLINLKKIPGMTGIEYDANGRLRIGALVTMTSLATSSLVRDFCPVLGEAAALLGSVQVRNLATLGGNICNAAPSAETAAPLLVLDAQVDIIGPSGARQLPLKDFFVGPGKTVLQKGELLRTVIIPSQPAKTGGNYFKLGSREAMDIAVVGVASVVTLKDGVCTQCRIALGAVAPTPMRAPKAEALLVNKKLDAGIIEKAGLQAMEESRPITDHRGSAEYRREMVRALTMRTVQEAAKRASAK